eukprot:CAMPEP_0172151478 /NCGR_PEP_ID=MMETSP1050-20130122/251_1 /TAXON_ID=233186 /ORGANISM="Cryptomonas curvata, Strain CCAP979/52" /LENGTH=56 /DNA_ID=CAMNT_0012819587 /DNA_START=1501 /DNA_END=1671 /DNA_ORIENTATION=-
MDFSRVKVIGEPRLFLTQALSHVSDEPVCVLWTTNVEQPRAGHRPIPVATVVVSCA